MNVKEEDVWSFFMHVGQQFIAEIVIWKDIKENSKNLYLNSRHLKTILMHLKISDYLWMQPIHHLSNSIMWHNTHYFVQSAKGIIGSHQKRMPMFWKVIFHKLRHMYSANSCSDLSINSHSFVSVALVSQLVALTSVSS